MAIRPPCSREALPHHPSRLLKLSTPIWAVRFGDRNSRIIFIQSLSQQDFFFQTKMTRLYEPSTRTSISKITVVAFSASICSCRVNHDAVAPGRLHLGTWKKLCVFIVLAPFGSDCVQIHNRSWVQPRTGSAKSLKMATPRRQATSLLMRRKLRRRCPQV